MNGWVGRESGGGGSREGEAGRGMRHQKLSREKKWQGNRKTDNLMSELFNDISQNNTWAEAMSSSIDFGSVGEFGAKGIPAIVEIPSANFSVSSRVVFLWQTILWIFGHWQLMPIGTTHLLRPSFPGVWVSS